MDIKAGRDQIVQVGDNSKASIDNRRNKIRKSWQENLLVYGIVTLVLGVTILLLWKYVEPLLTFDLLLSR